MKKSQIEIGGKYVAKVSGKLVTVRVDQIYHREVGYGTRTSLVPRFDVTNLTTGRHLTFRSAAKFRRVAKTDNKPAPRISAEQIELNTIAARGEQP